MFSARGMPLRPKTTAVRCHASTTPQPSLRAALWVASGTAASTAAICTIGFHVSGTCASVKQMQKDVEELGEGFDNMGKLLRKIARKLGVDEE